MANWRQVQLLKRGVVGWNRWRKKHPNVKPDLSRAELRDADLTGVNLRDADLTGAELLGSNLISANLNRARLREADLGGANLSMADLSMADLLRSQLNKTDLSGADLSGTDLTWADLFKTNLIGAKLHKASLAWANLSGTDLSGTDLSMVSFYQTAFLNIDLRQTKGLARINHRGPSAIHLPSLQLPQDGSALHFLHGVGLTDEQIDAWRSSAMLPIQYYSVFISYSSKDEILAYRLHADLQERGVRCWFAPEDMKIGNKIRDRIDQAIYLQDRSLLLLSGHSITSTWVENEVEAVLEKEDRQQREILFPVRLDEVAMHTSKAWAATLRRTRHIGDLPVGQIHRRTRARLIDFCGI
jgi:hypothetical protein